MRSRSRIFLIYLCDYGALGIASPQRRSCRGLAGTTGKGEGLLRRFSGGVSTVVGRISPARDAARRLGFRVAASDRHRERGAPPLYRGAAEADGLDRQRDPAAGRLNQRHPANPATGIAVAIQNASW